MREMGPHTPVCTYSQWTEPHFLVCVCCFYFWAISTFRRKGIRWSKSFNLRVLWEKSKTYKLNAYVCVSLTVLLVVWFPVSLGCPVIIMWAVWAITYWYLHLSAAGAEKTPERKGGNHCTSLVSVNYFSAFLVDFRKHALYIASVL